MMPQRLLQPASMKDGGFGEHLVLRLWCSVAMESSLEIWLVGSEFEKGVRVKWFKLTLLRTLVKEEMGEFLNVKRQRLNMLAEF